MAIEVKVCRFGDSLEVILPNEVIDRLRTSDGESLSLTEASEGAYQLTRDEPTFEDKMSHADDIISRYGNALHVLAQ